MTKYWEISYDVDQYVWVSFIEHNRLLEQVFRQELPKFPMGKLSSVFTDEEEEGKPISDFLCSTGGTTLPLCNEKAFTVIEPLIADSILPFRLGWINHPELQLYALYVTRVVDCVDKDHSEFTYFSSGKIMTIKKIAFLEDKLEGIHIFRIPDMNVSPIYVSTTLKGVIEEAGLTGLVFD